MSSAQGQVPPFPTCFTPYFVPDSTRPSMFGMSLCGMPDPLSCGEVGVGGLLLSVRARQRLHTLGPEPYPARRCEFPCIPFLRISVLGGGAQIAASHVTAPARMQLRLPLPLLLPLLPLPNS